jgi:hypothetical protein
VARYVKEGLTEGEAEAKIKSEEKPDLPNQYLQTAGIAKTCLATCADPKYGYLGKIKNIVFFHFFCSKKI